MKSLRSDSLAESLQNDAESATKADQPQSNRKTSTAAESLTHLFATYGLTGTESEPLGRVGLDSLRLAEFGSCHRNEPSGSLHGIMRVRGFTQDDAHIFCTEQQIESETKKFIALLSVIYKELGFAEFKIKFSDRPSNRAGSDHVWDRAEQALKSATTIAGYGITDAQASLVSATNIKTINGASILGSGNLTVTGTSDDTLQDYKANVNVTLTDANNTGGAHTDLTMSSDTSHERFTIDGATNTAIDLPNLTDSEFGKTIHIKTPGSGASRNLSVYFTQVNGTYSNLSLIHI